MKVKVIHIDKNGVETNFGEHDLSDLPSAQCRRSHSDLCRENMDRR